MRLFLHRFPAVGGLLLSALLCASAPAQCPPNYVQDFDLVRAPFLPMGWVASEGVNVTGSPLWVTSPVSPFTPPNDAFSVAPDDILDNRLDTTALFVGLNEPVYFASSYNLQSGRDGAVLEVSAPNINGGAFTDVTAPAVNGFLVPGYNSTISTAFQSPIAGRAAWSGDSGGYVSTLVFLGHATAVSQQIKLRFRLVSDNSDASAGWRIDNFAIYRGECSSPTPTATPSVTPTATATATPIATPCGIPNLMADSTFEAGHPWSGWTVQTSTNFDTPLCDTNCGTAGGTAPPYSGNNWAWFGGASAPETATLGQSVIIPTGLQATLNVVMRIGSVSSPFTDVLNIRVDGTIVQSYPEPTNSEPAYSLRTSDLSAYTDGASHLILFEYVAPTTGISNCVIDNVTLNLGTVCPFPTPSSTPIATATATPIITPTPTPPALIVTTAADSGPNSLRQALAGAHDGDIIGFDPALNGQTVLLTGSELAIDKSITITGPGPDLLAVSRNNSPPGARIFHVLSSHTVVIEGLTISGGHVGSEYGGGILNDDSTLTINNCAILGNTSISVDQASAAGGGIANSGTLTIMNSSVTDNKAVDSHSLPYPTVGGDGGGIFNTGTLTITNSAVNHNTAGDHFGALFPGGNGGGISNAGVLTITNSTIGGNQSGFSSGGISNAGMLTISESTISGNSAYGAHDASLWGSSGGIGNSGTMTITNSTVIANSAPESGGGIGNNGTVTITDSAVRGNSSNGQQSIGGNGGGIYNRDPGTLTIRNSTIDSNTSSGFESGYGAGIYNIAFQVDSTAMLSITDSTISGNSAFYAGGGIYNAAFNGGTATSTIANSTISGNSATFSGGGIWNSGTLTFTNSTLSGNSALQGDGIYVSGAVEIGNTVLKTGASGANIVNDGGTVTSHGYNLSSDDGGGFLTGPGDQTSTDPILGPLQDNGGPTFTHALLPDSPAIDTGDPNFIPPPLYDQRGPGYDRVHNGRIDVGAFEVQTKSTARLANISTRLRVETGDNIGIGGFIINGAGSLQVAIRGIGPSLGQLGIPDFLPDPILELRDSTGALLVQNDNWQDDPAAATQLTQLGLAPGDLTESALIVALSPGAYTAIVTGKNGGTGIGLVEVYNVDHSVPVGNIALANISTRGLVQSGNNVMIGGFILTGASSENAQVAVRGIGPSLTQFGITNALADPTLELHEANGATLVANDNWQDDPAQAAQLSAHGLAPSNPNESGIFVSVSPGLYSAILAGQNGGTGVGLVEIYNLP